MPGLQELLRSIEGVAAGVVLLAIAATWVLTFARLRRRYLATSVSVADQRQIEGEQVQHLNIAGLVLAALAIGGFEGVVGDLLVASFAAFVFAWALTWAPERRVTEVGTDALGWIGAGSLLLAVFIIAESIGPLAQSATLVALLGIALASWRDARGYLMAS
jgi:hypothetical protein